jgi:RNA polymerase sigma factor (sigma-70 family)
MSENDAELVSQSLSDSPGADDAFARLVARYRPAIYGLALAATGSAAEAEDLTQDTLIAAFLGLPQLRDPDRFGAWLKGIARNMLRMWYRRHAARPAFDGGHLLDEMDSGSQRLSPEEHVERQERTARIRQAVQDLSASNQQAIALRHWGEMSYAEIGDALNVPVSTVKSRLHKAKRQLHAQLHAQKMEARMGLIRVNIGEIYAFESEHGPAAIVALVADDGRSLPIWVGPSEGMSLAIARVLGRAKRPITFDLLADIFNELAIDVGQVVVSALKGNTFFATIHLTSDQGQCEIDARPSDAINIAVRTGAAVYVASDVMEQAGKIRHQHLPEELEPLEIPDWISAQLCDEPEE